MLFSLALINFSLDLFPDLTISKFFTEVGVNSGGLVDVVVIIELFRVRCFRFLS